MFSTYELLLWVYFAVIHYAFFNNRFDIQFIVVSF